MKLYSSVPSLFMMSLITLLITGCAAFKTDLRIFDDLPENDPKGYVEFYAEENEAAIELHKKFPGTFYVFKYEDETETEIKGMVWSWRTRRRVAVRPGMHTFILKYGSAARKVTVEVVEGMIIPVRVIFHIGKEEYSYKMFTQHFNMDLNVEKATRYAK